MNQESLLPIRSALISVYYKDGLEPLVKKLNDMGARIISTGGTQTFIEQMGISVTPAEELTGYPAILGGRVKTLHPAIFGGILARHEHPEDAGQLGQFNIPFIDLVIVDLYPFEETLASGADHVDIIEKIDIGGISLIRAGAKNYARTVILSSKDQYGRLLGQLNINGGKTSLEERQQYAGEAFACSSAYDAAIAGYFGQGPKFKLQYHKGFDLRYGENPHQQGTFYGDFQAFFDQLHGKELSYNNLLDVDAAVRLMNEFAEDHPTFAILKHNNACGAATCDTLAQAYSAALSCDPTSAFGGILIANRMVDGTTAAAIGDLFFEVIIAPGFSQQALELLTVKKNRIILVQKTNKLPKKTYRTAINGLLVQDADNDIESRDQFNQVTTCAATDGQLRDLEFAVKLVKHTKSNTIVLAKDNKLLASGTGQTSRVDSLLQAIHKAKTFGFDLRGAVMASDAFFPFPDCVEIAGHQGINAVVQPGGSVKDTLSVDYCNAHEIAMYMTGVRHFKH